MSDDRQRGRHVWQLITGCPLNYVKKLELITGSATLPSQRKTPHYPGISSDLFPGNISVSLVTPKGLSITWNQVNTLGILLCWVATSVLLCCQPVEFRIQRSRQSERAMYISLDYLALQLHSFRMMFRQSRQRCPVILCVKFN